MTSLDLRPVDRPQFDFFQENVAPDRMMDLERRDAQLGQRIHWTDEEVATLREGLLLRLRWLRDRRVSQSLRQDLLEWLSMPFRKTAEMTNDPFCFQACCVALRVDPDDMRERVLTMCGLEIAADAVELSKTSQLGFIFGEENRE